MSVGERAKGKKTWMQPTLGSLALLPCPFLHPLPSSAWPSVPFPGQLSRAGGLLAPGGNLLQVFTAGTQGDRKSGRVLTRDTGRKREGAWMFEQLGADQGLPPPGQPLPSTSFPGSGPFLAGVWLAQSTNEALWLEGALCPQRDRLLGERSLCLGSG